MSAGRQRVDSLAVDSLILVSQVDPADLWDAWRAACDDVCTAYDAWRAAPAGETADRYCGFVAAADREEAAAAALESRLRSASADWCSFGIDAAQHRIEHHDG